MKWEEETHTIIIMQNWMETIGHRLKPQNVDIPSNSALP